MRQICHRYLCTGFIIVFVAWNAVISHPVAADSSERFIGTVIFMRHALAPGTGDPQNFSINNCSTQRNLDNTGRRQARSIGTKLFDAKINFGEIYSSYWCRCIETAQLLGLGPVKPFGGLNSFYEGHVSRKPTLESLRKKLSSLSTSALPTLMVTHYVTIQAITGLSVQSGGVVVYNLKSGLAYELAFQSL